jgi:ankyrin repeat protein
MAAAAAGQLESLDVLLSLQADLCARDLDSCTALHHAATMRGDGGAACLQRLLESGASFSDPAAGGWTPLHFAASRG